MTVGLPALFALSAGAAALGSLGGLGGAVFLVPILVLLGVEPQLAAPLGILSVGAASLAAAPRQLADGLVHHRLGVTTELLASAGAVAGALAAARVSDRALTTVLALVALGAAATGLRRGGLRNPPRTEFAAELPGEWPGTLAGAYRLGTEVVAYQARRLPAGLATMGAAGIVSGLAGVGGGFMKTPAMNLIMGVPIKVAAATTTFTVGITAATSLVVFSLQGRVDLDAAPVVVLGGILGGAVGAVLQGRVRPQRLRGILSLALGAVGVVLLVSA
jgi:uncharacterized protein